MTLPMRLRILVLLICHGPIVNEVGRQGRQPVGTPEAKDRWGCAGSVQAALYALIYLDFAASLLVHQSQAGKHVALVGFEKVAETGAFDGGRVCRLPPCRL